MTPAKSLERVPLPIREWASRLDWKSGPADVRDSLGKVTLAPNVVDEFRPLCECLEWRVSDCYWSSAGVLPFAENEVPFLINNTGRLSENAALLLYANCCEAEPSGDIVVVEFGAGTGLFARYFLDTFQAVCEQEGRDYYDRLQYVVTDRSQATIGHWRERNVFAAHLNHVQPRACDASHPELSVSSPVRAFFCNYVLDVLPTAVVRTSKAGEPEQLCVRTHLVDDAALVAAYTKRSVEEIRQMVQSGDRTALVELVPLASLFDYEVAFRPDGAGTLPYAGAALQWNPELPRILLNFGALECLDRCLGLLAPAGFILINDYGPVRAEQVSEHATSQRFGITTALGLNFPLLDHVFSARGIPVRKPGGDDDRALHARLLLPAAMERTCEAFENRFSADAYDYFEAPANQARKHAAAGRRDEALECYRTALARSPRDWALVGEAAEFVSLQIKDHAAAVELCRAAVELNPAYSTWLWNVLGDALYCLERFQDAHEAYLQAERIDPNDGRTNLNLAYTYLQQGNYQDCLRVICRGLQADARGIYRDRLIEKQQQALSALSSRWIGEQDRMLKRTQRFSAS